MKNLVIILLVISTAAFAYLAFIVSPSSVPCETIILIEEPYKGHEVCLIDYGSFVSQQ